MCFVLQTNLQVFPETFSTNNSMPSVLNFVFPLLSWAISESYGANCGECEAIIIKGLLGD